MLPPQKEVDVIKQEFMININEVGSLLLGWCYIFTVDILRGTKEN